MLFCALRRYLYGALNNASALKPRYWPTPRSASVSLLLAAVVKTRPDLPAPSGPLRPKVHRARSGPGPGPLCLADPKDVELRKQQTTRACPLLRVVGTDRRNLRLASRKGAYCPKWELEASLCSMVGARAHSGARGPLMRRAIKLWSRTSGHGLVAQQYNALPGSGF